MSVHTAFYESPIGMLEIKTSEDNIHSILFVHTLKHGNRDVPLVSNQSITNHLITECINQLTEYFEGKRKVFDLPLKQEGTAFQQKVWTALLDIPFGNTISYLELSKRIGNTKAIRAVGTSNGHNNISIIVPCHRVIGANGDLTGYGGDLWRKKWLLELEGKYAHGIQTLF